MNKTIFNYILLSFFYVYCFAIAFVGCDNIYLPQNTHGVNALMAFLSLAFLIIVYSLNKEKNGKRFEIGILPGALILFLIYSAFSFYFSLNADLSGYPAIKILGALCLTIGLLYYLKNIEILKSILLIVFIFAGIHSCIGIIQQFIPSLLHQPNRFSFTSTSFFFNPNYYSGYLLLHIPIGVYLMVHSQPGFSRICLAGFCATIWIASGFSGSPGGQLIALAQIFAIVIYLFKKKSFQHLKLLGWGMFLALLVYVGLVNIIDHSTTSGSAAMAGSFARRPWVWQHIENRLMYWTGAWSIFKEHWLLGSGLWTFVELYPQTGLKYTPPHAHNMYLQTAAETGLVGFGLLMGCLFFLLSSLTRIFKTGKPEVVNISFYITVSLSGFLIQNLIEYNWLISNFIYYFVFFVVSLDLLSREIKSHDKSVLTPRIKDWQSKVVMVIIVLTAFTIAQYTRYQRIISHDVPVSQTVQKMSDHIAKAKAICSSCGRPYYLSGIVHLESFRQTKNIQHLNQAEDNFNEVLRRNPNGLGTYLMLGEIKILQENFTEARNYYELAMNDPRYKTFAIGKIQDLEKIIK